MRRLEEKHKELHEIIRRIVDLKQAGEVEQAEREFEQFEPTSHQVTSLLNVIERHAKQGTGQGPKQAPAPRRAATGSGVDSEWEEF